MSPVLVILIIVLVLAVLVFFFLRSGRKTEAEAESGSAVDGAPVAAEDGSASAEAEAAEQTAAPATAWTDAGALAPPTSIPEWARGIANLLDNPEAHKGGKGLRGMGDWVSFNVKGKELGFRMGELQMLYRTAQRLGLDEPKTLLWSERALDRCLQAVFWQQYKAGRLHLKDVEDLLFRMMQYRQGLEMGRPRFKRGIMSTRSMVQGQALKLQVSGVGIYTTRVTAVTRDYLEFELPKGRALPGGFTWKNRDVDVFFWKKDDAQYYFGSRVNTAPDRSMTPRLRMSHSENLIRTQKRASIRLKLVQDATIMPLRGPSEANETWAENQGYKARLIDISESGAAVLVRGVLEAGFFVKIQTTLAEMPVVLCGEIKSVNLNREKQYSILHIEAIPPSRGMRIRILAFVLGLTRVDSTRELATRVKQEQALESPDVPVDTTAFNAGGSDLPLPSEADLAVANETVRELEALEEEKL